MGDCMLLQSKEKKVNKELFEKYSKWYKEIETVASHLLGDKYSNPWYMVVPNNWFSEPERILIVGEDGFGFDGNGKSTGRKPFEIKRLQEDSLNFFNYHIANTCPGDHGFWTRARLVAFRGVLVAYTFLNKFSMRHDHRSKPNESDRKLMHATVIKLLAEEIKITQPTVVYFFGWYGDALKEELPFVHQKLYPGGDKDSSMWLDSFASFEDNGIRYIFSYNPYSPYWKNKPLDYEQQLLDELHKYITFTRAKQQRAIRKYETYTVKEESTKAKAIQDKSVKTNIVQKQAAGIVDNPVVNAVASYAIGKTVTENKKREKTVTFDPSYARDCSTCEYWSGKRTVCKRSNRKLAECENKRVRGECKNKSARHFYNQTRTADCGCGEWEKWDAL